MEMREGGGQRLGVRKMGRHGLWTWKCDSSAGKPRNVEQKYKQKDHREKYFLIEKKAWRIIFIFMKTCFYINRYFKIL